MHTIYRYCQIAGIGLATITCATWGTLLLPFGQSYALYTASQTWSKLLFYICGVRLQVGNMDHIDWSKPRIYVANHQSHIDTPVLFYALPVALFFIAKRELKHIPFLGWYMQLVGMVFIDRGDQQKAAKSMEDAAQQINWGKNILSFPEGTRSADGSIGLFKRGTFKMAIAHSIDIVPVGITGTHRIIPARSFDIHAGDVFVEVGEVIETNGWTDADALADYSRLKVTELQQAGQSRLSTEKSFETSTF